jgi:peptidoglycan/LPS O-acetylase OafA/YrhL
LTSIGTAYRTDIDGLRALAVLFVTVFHINEALIPGGFVGVDMFFVISGYLITGIIVRDHAAGRFSYSEFYRRRIRRIFPVMFVATIATLLAGLVLMLPSDVEGLSWSALATIFFGANIYFTYFLDTSYFASDSSTIPLLHMWSLGVEEQFYIIWPTLLLLLLKWPRTVIPAIIALMAASVAVGEWALGSEEMDWAYYMLPTRAFQLGMGGLLVFLAALSAKRIRSSTLLAVAGLALCLGSAFLLDGSDRYPGLNAVPVTLGTAALIAAGQQPNIVSRCLSIMPLRAVGWISFSLYLWHWPVLAFMRYFYAELSAFQQLLAATIMTALAVASYLLVEEPARQTKASLGSVALRYAALPAAACAAIVVWLVSTSGLGPYGSDYLEQVSRSTAMAEPVGNGGDVCIPTGAGASTLQVNRCLFSPNGETQADALLWGDSNAAHYVGAVNQLAKKSGMVVRNVASSACPPLVSGASEFSYGRYKERCEAAWSEIVPKLAEYPTIILGGQWWTYFRNHEFKDAFEATLRTLSGEHQRVIVLGQVPVFARYDRDCAAKNVKVFGFVDCSSLPHVDPSYSREDKAVVEGLANELPNLAYLDPYPFICPEGVCSPFVENSPIYSNASHLGSGGSSLLGRMMARDNSLF